MTLPAKNTFSTKTEVPVTRYREVSPTSTRPEVVHHYTHSSDGVLDTALKVGMVTSLMNTNRPAAPTNVRVENPTSAQTSPPVEDSTFLEFFVNMAISLAALIFIGVVGVMAFFAVKKKLSARR